MAHPLLTIRGLRVGVGRGVPVEIVRGVDLDVDGGEKVGIVGESGSGKTLSMLAVLGLLPTPALRVLGGSVRLGGVELLDLDEPHLRRVRGARSAMISQDPMSSLNPLLRVRTQIVETLVAQGVDRRRARERTREVLSQVGLRDAARVEGAFPYELSGGLRQRVMIATAIAGGAHLLIADEPTTALDVTVQEQILSLVGELQAQNRMAVVWVTHDLGVVARLVDRVAVMYAGRVVEHASTPDLFARPQHPYTAALLASLPRPGTAHRATLRQIPGSPPDPARLGSGCPYLPRCPQGDQECRVAEPDLLDRGPGRASACWKPRDRWQG